MPEKKCPLSNIADLARLADATMRRATTPLGDSFITQTAGMIRYCLKHQLRGNAPHPGVARMARLGKCSARQAQRNLRVLEAWGVMRVVAYPKGGRWATRYWMDIRQLRQNLIALGCNPSRRFDAKVEQAWGDIGGDICRDKCHVTMSPGIHKYSNIDFESVH